jgi:uncharacterized protein (UPF0548 family)
MTDTPLWKKPVNYAAVGATTAADLLRYPPAGYRASIASTRIGHGDARWEWASTAVRTWTVQRRADFTVDIAEAPKPVTEATYRPVGFDEEGVPVDAAALGDTAAIALTDTGERLALPGDTAQLTGKFGVIPVKGSVRVVYVVEEPDERGFAYGTVDGHAVRSEYAFLVSRRPDGSVWLEVRTVWQPATPFWRLLTPLLAASQKTAIQKFLRSLTGPLPN